MANEIHLLTTIDNPFNPFTQFKRWLKYDTVDLRYDTCGKVAKKAYTSEEFTDAENTAAVERAMDEIIKNDILGIYMKVTENDYKSGKFAEIYNNFVKERRQEAKNNPTVGEKSASPPKNRGKRWV